MYYIKCQIENAKFKTYLKLHRQKIQVKVFSYKELKNCKF